MSRGKLKRHRQLREESQRIVSREAKRYVPEAFNLWKFLWQRGVEFSLIAVLIIGVVAVRALGPDLGAIGEQRDSFGPLLLDQSLKWDKEFLYGYKVMVFTDKDIIQTSYDTLPGDLKINWKKMNVTRIQANQLNRTVEKIKIEISDIDYASAGIHNLTVRSTLLRQKGATIRLARFGELEFVVKIVDDDGNQLFCLFGLKGG